MDTFDPKKREVMDPDLYDSARIRLKRTPFGRALVRFMNTSESEKYNSFWTETGLIDKAADIIRRANDQADLNMRLTTLREDCHVFFELILTGGLPQMAGSQKYFQRRFRVFLEEVRERLRPNDDPSAPMIPDIVGLAGVSEEVRQKLRKTLSLPEKFQKKSENKA